MAEVQPFRAIRYAGAEISNVIAPPYDILSDADKQALLRKDGRNIVAIDLPHTPPKSAGPNSAYERAAGEMTRWLDIQVLVRDRAPALYAYHQTYQLGGETLTRKKFFARLRLEPFGTGHLFPHEQTFGGPKEDRFKLTQATRCNMSPIFGLYPDEKNEVAALIESAIQRPPDQKGALDGIENKLWAITDEQVVQQIQRKMADKAIFIADGHHRYGTALNYRDHVVSELGGLPLNDPANYVLAVLCSMEDPGATIQPYFRTIVDLPCVGAGDLHAALSPNFAWTAADKPSSAEELAMLLAARGPQSLALYIAQGGACATVTPSITDLLAAYEPDRKPAWRKSPYAIFHRYIVDEVVVPKFNGGKPLILHYHKNMEDAMKDADASKGIAILMPATTMQQLREICTAGELMPQKSTYFYPKLATGMVINPLY